jgi:phosphonate transport system permease protein
MSVTDLPRDAGDRAVAAFERARAGQAAGKRRQLALFLLLFAAAFAFSAWVGEVRPDNFLEGLPGLANYIGDTIPPVRRESIFADLSEWYWNLGGWLLLLLDTLIIAFLGTLFGVIGALVLCFPASRNLVRGTAIYFAARRLTEIARAVPELVYALIFVYAFGLGALPGVLAIAVHTAGALGKLFAEVNENIDMRPVDGVLAAGGGWLHKIRYAVIPQVLPNQVSYTLLRFEINVRSAAVIGFVGAGGIGQELMFVVRQFVYADISAIVLLIILTVSLIDMACEWLRHRLIGTVA